MRRSPSRAVLGLVVLALLLVAVAVASSGSVPAGAGGTRPPSHRLLDSLMSLLLVWMAVGSVVWLYLLLVPKGPVAEAAALRRRRRPWAATLGIAICFALVALGLRVFWIDRGRGTGIGGGLDRGLGATGPLGANATSRYEPEFATGPVVVVLGLLAVAIAAWIIANRARRRRLPPGQESLLPALADVLDETLDDLRAEADPRRAVIAAYARMERSFGAFGLPRKAAEAPDEYLRRILAGFAVPRLATSRLTALFAWAKFSAHEVGPEMKLEALAALEAVRAELRAEEVEAERQRDVALAALRGRAGDG